MCEIPPKKILLRFTINIDSTNVNSGCTDNDNSIFTLPDENNFQDFSPNEPAWEPREINNPLDLIAEIENYDFTGKRVCITGKFAIRRSVLKARLEKAGAEVIDSVSSQLDALLIGSALLDVLSFGNAMPGGWEEKLSGKFMRAWDIRKYGDTPLFLREDTVMKSLEPKPEELKDGLF